MKTLLLTTDMEIDSLHIDHSRNGPYHSVISGSRLVWEGSAFLLWGKHTRTKFEGPLFLLWTRFVSVSHPPSTGSAHTPSGRGIVTRSLTFCPFFSLNTFWHHFQSPSVSTLAWNNVCWIKYSCHAAQEPTILIIQLEQRFPRVPCVYAADRMVSIDFCPFFLN